MAATLAELQADLILCDLDRSALDELADNIQSDFDVSSHKLVLNLEDKRAVSAVKNAVLNHSDTLDILVNNAAFVGTSELEGWNAPFEEQSIETWDRAMDVNLSAAFTISQKLYPLLKKSGAGNIINVGSIYGMYGPDNSLYEGLDMHNPAAYAASKGGLLQLTRYLATVMAPDVRVNTLSPGGVFRHQDERFVERYIARTPLKRMATEDDLRGALTFLASDMSSYVTGQNIMVDGGWGAW